MATDSQEMGCLARSLGVLASLITIYTFVVSIGSFAPLQTPTVIAAVSSLSLPSRSLLAIVIQAALGRFFLTGCLIADNSRSVATAIVGVIAAASLTGWLTIFNVATLLIHKDGHTLLFLAFVFVGLSVTFLVVLAEDKGVEGFAFWAELVVFIIITIASLVAR